MTKFAAVDIENLHLMTGLAEYRSGGLFVDMGVSDIRNI
jgi:hypothetical protein